MSEIEELQTYAVVVEDSAKFTGKDRVDISADTYTIDSGGNLVFHRNGRSVVTVSALKWISVELVGWPQMDTESNTRRS